MIHVKDNLYKVPYIRWNGKAANRYYIKTRCYCCDSVHFQERGNSKKTNRSVCSKECKKKLMSGKNNTNFKNGIKKKKRDTGYHIHIFKPEHPHAHKNYIPEHRFVVEEHIGRLLKKEERIHHIDMVMHNNDIKNLHINSDQTDHSKTHGSLNKCVKQLLDNGYLLFDSVKGVYKVK